MSEVIEDRIASLVIGLLNGQTPVHHGSAADPNGSARTFGGPLANLPGVIFLRTQAGLL